MQLATQPATRQSAASRVKGYPVCAGVVHPFKVNSRQLGFLRRTRNLHKGQQQQA
jgi:hypothetical protein